MNLLGRFLVASFSLVLLPGLSAQDPSEVRDPVRDALDALRARTGTPAAETPAIPAVPSAPEAGVPSAPAAPEAPTPPAPLEEILPLPSGDGEPSDDAVSGGLGLLSDIKSRMRINSASGTSYDRVAQIFVTEGADIVYDDVRIVADRTEYHRTEGEIRAFGNVEVYKGSEVFRGDEFTYNTNTGEVSSSALKSSVGPILFETDEYQGAGRDAEVLQTSGTYFTTHDSASPNYHIKAKTVDIYPDDRIVFRGASFYVGTKKVFYLPYFVQPFDDELGYFFRPGYNSFWGAFLLNKYGFLVGDHTLAKVDFDLRSARGAAVGLELESLRFRDNPNFGRIKFYYAYDIDPELSYSAPTRENLDGRYRINFQHRIYLSSPEDATLYADFDINYLSDQHFYEDFFFSEFRLDPRPDNLVNLVKHHERGTLSLTARFELNDFFRNDTRLPELALDMPTQQVFNTGLFYRSNTSFGMLRDNLTPGDQFALFQTFNFPGNQLLDEFGQPVLDDFGNNILIFNPNFNDPEFTRLHTWHEFLYPIKLGNVLNITPRVGAGFQDYSAVGGTTGVLEETSFDRQLVGGGVEASMKWSKAWDDVENTRLGVHGIRHIAQPYLNYSYLDAGDSLIDQGFRGVDVWRPTTRLRPIDVPLMTGIDDLRTWNVVRGGVRNVLQTRRNDGTHNWMGLNTYIDHYIDDPESDRDLSNLHNDFYWHPLPWVRLSVESQIPTGDDPFNFTEVNSRLTWMPTRNTTLGFSHLYINDHPIFEDSSKFALSTYLRMGDNWGFSTFHSFEAEDSQLEYQSYRIHRDLTSWTASLGGVVLGGRGEQEDAFGLVLTFTLKDFPDVTIPLDFNPSPGG